jgi:hypothetical protein
MAEEFNEPKNGDHICEGMPAVMALEAGPFPQTKNFFLSVAFPILTATPCSLLEKGTGRGFDEIASIGRVWVRSQNGMRPDYVVTLI